MTIEEIIKEAFSRGWNASHECATDFDYDCALNGFLSEVETEVKKFRIGDVRVRFYLCDYDEDIWALLPARINNGDSFYMDCFVGSNEEKLLKPGTYEDMIYGAILYCKSSIWGQDDEGVYQQVYLVEELES